MPGHHRRKFHYFRNRNPQGPDATKLLMYAGAGVAAYLLYQRFIAPKTVTIEGLADVAVRGKNGTLIVPTKVIRTKVQKRVPRRKIKRAGKRDRMTRKVISAPVNGLEGFGDLAGWGSIVSKVKKAVSSAGSAVSKTVKQVTVPAASVVQKVAPVVGKGISTAVTAPIKITREIVRPIDPLNDTVGKVLDKPLDATDKLVGTATSVAANVITAGSGKEQVSAAPAAAPITEYLDADGNPITKEEYDRLMALANQPIYQDADGHTITKEEYDRLMAEYNASLLTPPVPNTPADTNSGAPVSTSLPSSSSTTPITAVVPAGSQQSAVVYDTGSAYPSAPSVSSQAPADGASAPAADAPKSGINPVVAVGAAAGATLLFSALGS